MKSHELLRTLLQHRNAKELASETNLSTSTIYKWTQPPTDGGSGTVNPLDRVEQLIQHTDAEAVAQWLCERAGGFFVKNTGATKENHSISIIKATNKIVQEFAEMLALIATAATDSSVTDEETRAIRSRWQELKSVTEEFVICCEQGDFKTIHAHGQVVKNNPST